ncbi:MAG: InlB B-repeat-containing protein [Clostridia bacterium]|nr:InlB B-repeat-containing protein [Clostridia bacterium]
MKKKIIAIMLVTTMLIANFMVVVQAAGEWWERTGGSDLKNIATEINDEIYADSKYNAKTNTVPFTGIEMYEYGTYNSTKSIKEGTGSNVPVDFTQANGYKYYWTVRDVTSNGKNYEDLYYTIQIPQNISSVPRVASIVYEDGITYDGNKYNVVINIKEITKTTDDSAQILFRAGEREKISTDQMNTATYTMGNSPQIGVLSTNAKVQVNVEYIVTDKDGNKVNISGLFGITDIDNKQGTFMNDYSSNASNTFMAQDAIERNNIKYKNNLNGLFIYGVDEDTTGDSAYLLVDNKNTLDLTFTYEGIYALSTIRFEKYFNRYYKIATKVTPSDRATITDTIDEIKDGESKTVSFAPQDPTTQYLKSVKIDGKAIETKVDGNDITSYTFSNIKDDHKVVVVYGDIYPITYVLNGGTNDSNNPSTYKSEDDDITFQNPTRDGYDFKGWFTTPDFQLGTEKPGIATGSTGAVTVYAKWEAKKDTKYTVEHYKENTDGEYELVLTDELTADTDSVVTATPHDFPGYVENTTIEDRIPTGTVTADGTLVLKLYYDRKDYTVTFEPKNDTKIDNQIVKYLEKATEPTKPTKEGYTFEYWYFLDENLKPVEYDFENKVNRDIDLIAKWKEVEVTPSKDDTTPKKEIPKAGREEILLPIAGIVIVAGAIFGKKYFNLKKDIK